MSVRSVKKRWKRCREVLGGGVGKCGEDVR